MEENQSRTDLTQFAEKVRMLKESIAKVVVGQEQTVDLLLTAVLANGHVLIEAPYSNTRCCFMGTKFLSFL